MCPLPMTKLTIHLVFDLKYRAYSTKKFSRIFMNSTSIDVYNTRKNQVNDPLLYIYFCMLWACSLFSDEVK